MRLNERRLGRGDYSPNNLSALRLCALLRPPKRRNCEEREQRSYEERVFARDLSCLAEKAT